MGHLVKPYILQNHAHLSLAECQHELQFAHDYLVVHGAEALARIQPNCETRYWGCSLKRTFVQLPQPRPAWVTPRLETHSLSEVYNQCATMERLLDTLAWAQTPASGLREYMVERCHPTTSSAQTLEHTETWDNDLVLVGPSGAYARFEVSDVMSQKDGNRKEEKDLRSLGVLGPGNGSERFDVVWPAGHLFLVVAEEFATRLQRPSRSWLRGHAPHCRYIVAGKNGTTVILQVVRGALADTSTV